jgi:hypothetical protein
MIDKTRALSALFALLALAGAARAGPAEDALLFRSCAELAEQRGKADRAELFRQALEALSAPQQGPTRDLLYGQCLGLVGNAVTVITSAPRGERR